MIFDHLMRNGGHVWGNAISDTCRPWYTCRQSLPLGKYDCGTDPTTAPHTVPEVVSVGSDQPSVQSNRVLELMAEVMTSHSLTAFREHSAASVTSETDEDTYSVNSTASAQLRDSASDFNKILDAANLKIKLARAADAAARDLGCNAGQDKPVVITFLPCCNETKDELSNPLSLVMSPDADAKLLLERVSMQFYVVVDGQHDNAPETSTLKALKEILNMDEEQDQPVPDRGCQLYHLFRNDFEVFVYVKGKSQVLLS